MNVLNKKIKFIKINEENNQRIDNYLKKILKKKNKNDIYKIIRKGSIRINKKRVKFFYKLKYNDILRIKIIKNKFKLYYLNNLEKHIIYEDKDILVIKKPTGIAVHGGSNIKCGIIESIRILRNKDDFLELVHRLDRETSGILLIAKNRKTLIFLNKEMYFKNIKKKYLSLVNGIWKKKNSIIELCIKKNIKKNINNKYTKTLFKIIRYYKFYTLLKILPITGYKHQIRIHTSYVNKPILFDKIYNKNLFDNKYINNKKNRLFLHAETIILRHPYNKKYIKIISNIDFDLYYFLKKLK
ncbi:MAG: RluA family pseudouridine synthase [Enterobacteriaceae bacterium PSpyr]|nr:MAG: RluA family pseudouridine synthase [Enterobacteriaceae bacterium PSpyr]